MVDAQAINAIGKPRYIQIAVRVGLKIGGVLVGLAEKMNRRLNAAAGWIGYAESQFSAVALAKCGEAASEQENDVAFQQAPSRDPSVFPSKTLSPLRLYPRVHWSSMNTLREITAYANQLLGAVRSRHSIQVLDGSAN